MPPLVTLTLFDILLLGYLYSLWPGITNQKILHPDSVFSNKTPIIWIIITVFCVYAGWDTDYQHYYMIYQQIYENIFSIFDSHMEIAYYPFITLSLGNYSLFRFYIWGLAALLAVLTLKRLDLNNNTAAITFASFNLLYFSYARVSLAILIYIYGLMLFCQQRNAWKIITKLWGLILVLTSILFHKSMLFMILLTPLAFIRMTKPKVVLCIMLLPFFFIIMQYVKEYILSGAGNLGDIDELLQISSTASTYVSRGSFASGPIGMLISFIETAALFYGLMICWKRRKIFENEYIIRGIWNITVGLFAVALFSTILNLGYVISRRVMLLGYICLFYVLAYIFVKQFKKKEFVGFCLLSMGYSSIKIIYFLYVNRVYGF